MSGNGVLVQQSGQCLHQLPGALALVAVVQAVLKIINVDAVEWQRPHRKKPFLRCRIAGHRRLPGPVGGFPGLIYICPCGYLFGCGAVQFWKVVQRFLFCGKSALGGPDRHCFSVFGIPVAQNLHRHPAAALALVHAPGTISPPGGLSLFPGLLLPAGRAESRSLWQRCLALDAELLRWRICGIISLWSHNRSPFLWPEIIPFWLPGFPARGVFILRFYYSRNRRFFSFFKVGFNRKII